jgi:NitT/TauT family transport system substrate-binding protein
VPKVLEAREATPPSDLVDIAQIFQRSGTLSVTWKADGIDDPCKLAGKKVGTWAFGNEFEVTAGLLTCGLTPGLENNGKPDTQYQKVIQAFDMKAFLAREIDAAEAMIYNEYAQVLEATDPNTGELYKPDQLNIINWNDYRVAMLQDAIFVRKAWLSQGQNRDVAVRFVRASIKGWIYCRDHPDDCVQYTTDAGSQLGTGHQKWMMNEVNALIWPSPLGIGVIDPVFWGQTVKVAKNGKVIKADPSIDAYTTDIVTEALAGITDDTKGTGFTKGTVEVTPNGT